MDNAKATIKKVGDKYCVYSQDGSKNLGCSDSLEGAKKRLQQIEYFKHVKGQDMDYNQVFANMGKAFNNENSQPEKLEVHSETLNVSNSLKNGSIAGMTSTRLLDKRDHFPIVTETQARSSFSRAMTLREVPSWYNGTLSELRQEVYANINQKHPGIDLRINIAVDKVLALSDGKTPSETVVKDPGVAFTKEVPGIKRPTLTSAELSLLSRASENEATRSTMANQLITMIESQEQNLAEAKKIAQKLFKKGLSSEDFATLSSFLQEDILRSLLMNSKTSASLESVEDRRLELLKRISSK